MESGLEMVKRKKKTGSKWCKAFLRSLSSKFLAVELHDWCDIRGWTHGRQVRAVLGRNKVLIGTLISNGIFPECGSGVAACITGATRLLCRGACEFIG